MGTRIRRIVLSGLMAAAIALALAAPSVGATYRVRATDTRTWSPAFREVPKFSKVVWKNPTTLRHTVTAYRGNWSKNSVIQPGGQTSFTFRTRGRFKYRCTLHSTLSPEGACSGMCGRIRVVP